MGILRIILSLIIVCIVVVYMIYSTKNRKGDKDEGEDTYMSVRMMLGMSIGTSIKKK